MATTEENLATAFAGESQANRKYLAFAKQADKEGFSNIATLFRAASEAETIHAHGHLNAMGGVKTTLENLRAAVEGERYEHNEMYPPMLAQAEKEGHKAARMFKFAMETEKVHADLYELALKTLEGGKDLDADVYLCPVCGHLELNSAPDNCPVCGLKAERFTKID